MSSKCFFHLFQEDLVAASHYSRGQEGLCQLCFLSQSGDTKFKHPVPGPETTITQHGVGLPTCKAPTGS